ncbi:MAG TPA: hypothetical protein VLV50_13650 [Stellaceae bacterium]|nr:hypothetical protein [Stellaceae bacterium]
MTPNIVLITLKTAAAQAGCSISTVRRLIDAGAVRLVKLNPHAADAARAGVRIVEAEWQAYLASRLEARAP